MSATPVQVVPNSFKPLPAPSAPPSGGAPAVDVVAGSFKPLSPPSSAASNDVAKQEVTGPGPVDMSKVAGSAPGTPAPNNQPRAAAPGALAAGTTPPEVSAYSPTFTERAENLVRNSPLGHAIETVFPNAPAALKPTTATGSPEYQEEQQGLRPEQLVQGVTRDQVQHVLDTGARLATQLKGGMGIVPGQSVTAPQVPQGIFRETAASAATPAEQVATSAAKRVGEVTNAPSVASLAAIGAGTAMGGELLAPALGALGLTPGGVELGTKLGHALAGAGFTAQMGLALAKQVPEYRKALNDGDETKAHALLGSMLVDGTLTALAAGGTAGALHGMAGNTHTEAAPEPTEKPEDEKPVLHASNDVEELRASAERQADKIGDAATAATKGVPGAKLEAVRDAKDSDRIGDKAERQGVDPNQIADIAAAKITVPDQAAAEQVLQNLHQEMPVESVNGSVTGEPGKNGVRQVQAVVNTQTPGEPVQRAEVLIQTPEMSEAAGDTHDDYRRSQELRAAGKDDEADALEAKIMREHEEAEGAAQQRIGAPSDNPTIAKGGRGESPEQPAATGGQTPAAAKKPSVREALNDFMTRVGTRLARERYGQTILDYMEERGESPSDVSKQFWEHTYLDMPAEAQTVMQRQLKALTGMEPGDTLATRRDAEGNVHQIPAKDWADIANGLVGDKVEHLEGPERGYVAMMRDAIDRFGKPSEPSQTSAAALPAETERRTNTMQRQRIDQMTPEELRQTLLTSEKTGLPNKRAFDEAQQQQPSPAVAMSDADGLKALNDKFGYDAGDALLRAKADALREAGLEAFHDKGDEFLYRGFSKEELKQRLDKAREILRNRVFDVEMTDGSVHRFKGADFSYGTGTETPEAERSLKDHKAQREASGERARGELRGIARVGPEEGKGDQAGAGGGRAAEIPAGFPDRPTVVGHDGRATDVLTPTRKLPATYRLVEAADLIPSHDAQSFAPNAAYPEGVQERDYEHSKEAQNRVVQQSQNYDPAYTVNTNPDAVNGPPVITPDGTVLGGNSRAMSTQRLYAEGNGEGYRDALKRDAATYGLNPDQVDGMKEPVLVRQVERPESQEEARRIGSELNKSMTGALGVSERAVSAGKNLKPETLRTVAKMLNEDDSSLRELLARRGPELLRMMGTDGVITERERPQFVDAATGGLSEEGKTFFERALLGSAIDDPRLMDAAPKSILGKIERSLGAIASFGSRADEWNLLPAVREAVAEHAAIAKAGSTVELRLGQRDMFGPGRNPVVDALVRALDEKPTAVHAKFEEFARDADQHPAGQVSMFGGGEAFEAFNHAFGSTLTKQEYIDGNTQAIRANPASERSGGGGDSKAALRNESLPGRAGVREAGGGGEGVGRAPKPPSRAEGSAAGARAEVSGRPELASSTPGAAPRPPKPVGKPAFSGGRQSTPIEVRDAEGNWQRGTLDYYNDGVNGTPRRGRVTLDNGFKMNNVADGDMRAATEKAETTFKQSGQKKADVGVDFDGTLATDTGTSELGKPLPERVASVKRMLADGKTVEIITRRVENDPTGAEAKKIQDWLEANGLPRLPVTDEKTAGVLYDDNAYHAPTNADTPLPTAGRTPDVKPGDAQVDQRPAASTEHPDIARERKQNAARAEARNAEMPAARERPVYDNAANQSSEVMEVEGHKALVLDPDGELLWHRGLDSFPRFKRMIGSGESWRGMTMDPAQTKAAIIAFDGLAQQLRADGKASEAAIAGVERLADSLQDARSKGGSAMILRSDFRADTAREEAAHVWMIDHGMEDSAAIHEVASRPEFHEAMEQLRDQGYRDRPVAEQAVELMAHVLAGDPDLRLSDAEREELARAFLTESVEEHGPEILRNLPAMDPRLNNIRKEVTTGYDYGDEYAQGDAGGGIQERGGQGKRTIAADAEGRGRGPGQDEAGEADSGGRQRRAGVGVQQGDGEKAQAPGELKPSSQQLEGEETSGPKGPLSAAPDDDIPLFQRAKDSENPVARTVAELVEDLKSLPKGGKRTALDRVSSWTKDTIDESLSRSGRALGGVPSRFEKAFAWAKSTTAALIHDYRNPLEQTDWKHTAGQMQLSQAETALRLQELGKALKEAAPKELDRIAMTHWMEAAGDKSKLEEWRAGAKARAMRAMNDSSISSDRRRFLREAQAHYDQALKLTPEQQKLALRLRQHFDDMLDVAKQNGLLKYAYRNYVTHIYEKAEAAKILNLVDTSELDTEPRFAGTSWIKERWHRTYFEAEGAGLTPRSKDIGYLLTAYDKSMNDAIASRNFMRSLLDAKAPDGRPIAAIKVRGGWVIAKGDEAPLVLKQRARPSSLEGYRDFDRPQLRNFLFKPTLDDLDGFDPKLFDEDPRSLAFKGDLIIHPKYASRVEDMLTPSWFERGEGGAQKIGHAIVKGSGLAKELMTAVAPFHMVQEGVHGLEHKVNPFKLPKIDLGDKTQRLLASHGLTLTDYDAEGLFSARALRGVTEFVPGLNKAMDQMQSFSRWQFEDYIPRLKMSMALDSFERNVKRYPKLSEEQVAELSAKQSNAAFGNLNTTFDAIPRTKTFKTLLRLATFAPDFLESRIRFVGQAFTKYGGEQRAALVRGALIMYTTARVANAVLNQGDAKWDAEHAFSIVANGRSYSLRTVQGDILHAVTDPRGFIYNRLNPLTTRPVVEFLSGRDQMGRQKSGLSQIKDLAKSTLPFGVQKVIQTPDEDWLNSILTSTGLEAKNYRTPTEEEVHKLYLEHIPDAPEDEEKEAEGRKVRQIEDKLRSGHMSPADVWALVQKGDLTAKQARRTIDRAHKSRLQIEFQSLSLKNAMNVYADASPLEQAELRPELEHKRGLLAELPEADRRPTAEKMTELLAMNRPR